MLYYLQKLLVSYHSTSSFKTFPSPTTIRTSPSPEKSFYKTFFYKLLSLYIENSSEGVFCNKNSGGTIGKLLTIFPREKSGLHCHKKWIYLYISPLVYIATCSQYSTPLVCVSVSAGEHMKQATANKLSSPEKRFQGCVQLQHGLNDSIQMKTCQACTPLPRSPQLRTCRDHQFLLKHMFSSKEILLEKNTPYLSNNSGNY